MCSPPPPRARRSTAPISSTAPKTILAAEIRVLSGREEAYYSALGVISGFHPANGIAGDLGGGSLELVDVNGESDRRRHHPAAGRPAPAGHGQELAGQGAAKIARDELARAKLLKGGQGRPFYAVGGTWRNLARLHMEMTNYPLGVMHHYEIGIESCDALPQAGGAKATSRRSRASKASRRTAARCCPTAPSCCRRSWRR